MFYFKELKILTWDLFIFDPANFSCLPGWIVKDLTGIKECLSIKL